MTWTISLKGHDDHDNDQARTAHDYAVHDKARGLFNDIARLTGGQVTEAYVETTATGKVDFVPAEDEDSGAEK